MLAVPEGFQESMRQNGRQIVENATKKGPIAGSSPMAAPNDLRTQGFNIVLPFEQKLNGAIEVAGQFEEFPFRKLALYENARGVAVFPGGFGTLDELFEVLNLAGKGRLTDPVVLVGQKFWGPLLAVVEKVAVTDRALIDSDFWKGMKVTDHPGEVVKTIAGATEPRAFEENPEKMATRMTREIQKAVSTLSRLPPAVTFIGSDELAEEDPALVVLGQAAEELARRGTASRVGGSRRVAEAVVQGTRRANPRTSVQGFFFKDEAITDLPGLEVHQTVSDLIVHKELLTRSCRGLVAGPGGVGTLGKVFSLLCEIQTGKAPRVPVILVGKDYWQPIFEAIRTTMLDPAHTTIGPNDLDLVTITDDPQVIVNAFSDNAKPRREDTHGR